MTVWQRATLLAFLLAAAISVAFVIVLKPVDAGSFVFWAVWLAWPHVALTAILVITVRSGRPVGAVQRATVLVSLLGPLLLADAVFLHPDAQGGLGVLMVPIAQLGCWLVLMLPVWLGWRWTR